MEPENSENETRMPLFATIFLLLMAAGLAALSVLAVWWMIG